MKTQLSHPQRAARRREIAAAIKSGRPSCDVALDYGVTLGTIRQACAESGVEWPAKKKARGKQK